MATIVGDPTAVELDYIGNVTAISGVTEPTVVLACCPVGATDLSCWITAPKEKVIG